MLRSSYKFGFWLVAIVLFGAMITGVGMQGCSSREPGTCTEDSHCSDMGDKKVCDKNNGKCVECLKDSHCAKGESCNTATYTCTTACRKDEDCDQSKGKQACRAGACVPSCDSNEDCKPTEKCKDNQCVDASCKKNDDCEKDEVCFDGVCKAKGNRPGKYEECPGPKGEDCQDGLKCLTYKGGTVNYCWKPCSKGCDKKTEVCVKEDKFAQGHSVCMKVIKTESAAFNYDEGTACSDKLIALTTQGHPEYGTCWKTCQTKCLGDRKCLNHPNIDDDKVKLCFKPCKSDDDCPNGSSCQEHTKANNEFYCF